MKNILILLFILFTITACKAQINAHKYQKKGVTLEEIQQAIEYNLNQINIWKTEYYRIPYPPYVDSFYYRYNYFTEKAKKRIIELLERKWTEEEIQSQLKPMIKSELDTLNPRNEFYKSAKKIAKRDSLPLQRVWDSILNIRKNEYRKSILEDRQVPKRIISIAGYLKDPRFLPYLKTMAESKNMNNSLALARYGKEPYLSNAVEYYAKKENWQRLAYICSKKAIDELYKYAITNEEVACDSNGMDCYDLWAELPMGILASLFDSKEMSKEIDEIKRSYKYPKRKEIDKAYIKKMRAITKKYYTQFKLQEPNCENVLVNAW